MHGNQQPTTTELVMRWWSEILPVAPTSVDDDFFDLGGQSMQLVRFLQWVYDRYHVELPVAELFGEPFTAARAGVAIDRETAATIASGDR